jgi:hypothetical protein
MKFSLSFSQVCLIFTESILKTTFPPFPNLTNIANSRKLVQSRNGSSKGRSSSGLTSEAKMKILSSPTKSLDKNKAKR